MIPLLLSAVLALVPPALAQPGADVEGWRLTLDDIVLQAQLTDPELAAHAADAAVVPTRSGGLRVIDLGSEWGPVLLADRLASGQDAPEVRLAVAAGIATRIHQWPEIAAGLVDAEADPAVLGVLLAGLQRVPPDLALPRLQTALSHSDSAVRVEAAVVLGRHADGAAAADALVVALGDDAAMVRGRAARALGRHAVGTAFEPLRGALADDDAAVRLQALRALEKVDAARTAALPELGELAVDSDHRVARVATELRR